MFTIRDTNNPLETCSIELSGLEDTRYPGLFEINDETIKIWFILDFIQKKQAEELYSELYQNYLHTVRISSKQGNYFTSFQTITVSPMEYVLVQETDGSVTKKPCPMVPNGLLLMKSQNWIEDALVDDLNECIFKRAVFTFPYLPYWFNQSLEVGKPKKTQINDSLSITFSLEESKAIQRFSIQESKVHFSRVIVEASSNLSVVEFYNLHRDILLLFRFCTGINLPKAFIVFELLEKEQPPHRFNFHYLFPFKGIIKDPNPNQYLKPYIRLSTLINNEQTISKWINCVRSYQHAMELLGEVFCSNEIVISDRVLKLLQVFDRLDKAFLYEDRKKVPCLNTRLEEFVKQYHLSFTSITDLDEEKICTCLKDYRNSESHGDENKDTLSFEQMERIMHILIVTLIKDKVLGIPD